MKHFDLVLMNSTGEAERVGSINAPNLKAAQDHLAKKWRNENKAARTPVTVRVHKADHTAVICFQSHELHIIDTTAEAAERKMLEHCFAGDHTAETT